MGSLGTRSKEISQHVDEQMQQATQRLQEHPAWGGSLVSEIRADRPGLRPRVEAAGPEAADLFRSELECQKPDEAAFKVPSTAGSPASFIILTCTHTYSQLQILPTGSCSS